MSFCAHQQQHKQSKKLRTFFPRMEKKGTIGKTAFLQNIYVKIDYEFLLNHNI